MAVRHERGGNGHDQAPERGWHVGKTRPFKVNVVACAVALKNEDEAKRIFGVADNTRICRNWIDGFTVKQRRIEGKFDQLAAHERSVRQALRRRRWPRPRPGTPPRSPNRKPRGPSSGGCQPPTFATG